MLTKLRPNVVVGGSLLSSITWVVVFVGCGVLFQRYGFASSQINAPPHPNQQFQQPLQVAPNDIKISLNVILSIAVTIAGAVMTGYVAILRYAIGQEKARFMLLLEQHKIDLKSHEEVHKKDVGELKGDISQLQVQNRESNTSDSQTKLDTAKLQISLDMITRGVSELKQSQITRVEWDLWNKNNETRLSKLEQNWDKAAATLSKISGQYSIVGKDPTK